MDQGIAASEVYLIRPPKADYGRCHGPPAPELAPDVEMTSALLGLRGLLASAQLDLARYGTAQWNPLGGLVGPGKTILVKPNWVHHENHSGKGLECLVTHVSVVEAVLHYVAKTQPARVILGDAPIQGCDFRALETSQDLGRLCRRFRQRELPLVLADLRQTVLPGGKAWGQQRPTDRGNDCYVLFDLGQHSALEPVTANGTAFRVSMYDPVALKRHHGPGRHRYSVAREAIEADLVINLPKLKTHRKAGLTGAVKNLVGLSGHKEYLPHHRRGSAKDFGDSYPCSSRLKRWAEAWLDWANGASGMARRFVYSQAAGAAIRLSRWLGEPGDLEGSWHGNDTLWRTCLDVHRIVLYGRADGTMADTPQRRLLHVTDAVVAGEGEGPLSPQPVSLGLMTLSLNAAAADWVHALLMGIDPHKIPLVREAFALRHWPVAGFPPEQIRTYLDGDAVVLAELHDRCGRPFRPARGWAGHCELAPRHGGELRC